MSNPIEKSQKFKQWKSLAEMNGLTIEGVKNLSTVHKYDGKEVLFSFLEVDARTADGRVMHPNLLIRGHAVIILPILIPEGGGEPYTILVKQLRCATGGILYELPAGMMDEAHHDPLGVATREFAEEVGLDLGQTRLHRMNESIYYTSPGLLDEGIYFFYFEKAMPREKILDLHHKQTGCEHEQEEIELAVVPFNEAFALVNSIPAQYALSWYKINKDSGDS